MMARTRRDENGSTLIELLIATMLSIVLITVVAMTFILGQRTDAHTGVVLNESNDAQLVNTYLPGDLQSVSPGSADVVIGNGVPPMIQQNAPSGQRTQCSPDPLNDATHFNALRLKWTQADGT